MHCTPAHLLFTVGDVPVHVATKTLTFEYYKAVNVNYKNTNSKGFSNSMRMRESKDHCTFNIQKCFFFSKFILSYIEL